MGDCSGCLEKAFPQFIFPPGRAGLNNIRGVNNDRPYVTPGTVAEESPEPALMRFHFECALHKNIVGCGPREAKRAKGAKGKGRRTEVMVGEEAT